MASLRHTCFPPRDLIKCSRGTIVNLGHQEQSELRVGKGIKVVSLRLASASGQPPEANGRSPSGVCWQELDSYCTGKRGYTVATELGLHNVAEPSLC